MLASSIPKTHFALKRCNTCDWPMCSSSTYSFDSQKSVPFMATMLGKTQLAWLKNSTPAALTALLLLTLHH